MRIDLHTHSRVSDGTQAPEDVMESAVAAGLDVVALTDHDTTAGWPSAQERAKALGIEFVPGIEISCEVNHTSLHLLGYFVDPADPALLAELGKARESRETRAQRMVELLGPDTGLTWADVEQQVRPGATIGRPHIADGLVARGVVGDRAEAFDRYLHSGSRYHVSHYAVDPLTGVRLVLEAGGVPVLAHPFAHVTGRVVPDKTVDAMADAGLVGIEVDHRDQDETARAKARAVAGRHGLVMTGSSDYHGDGKPNRLGENTTTEQAYERIRAAARDTTCRS
ncbi:PHP domain-containing protein [Calidifontibacter terrae]